MQPLITLSLIVAVAGMFGTARAETCPEPIPAKMRAEEMIACLKYLKAQVDAAKAPIPARAILPFKDVVCPPGWTPYIKGAGRVVMGLGKGPGRKEFTLEEAAGASEITITLDNLPSHQHDTLIGVEKFYAIWGMGSRKTGALGKQAGEVSTGLTSSAGADKPTPIPIVPPYVALLYCEKN